MVGVLSAAVILGPLGQGLLAAAKALSPTALMLAGAAAFALGVGIVTTQAPETLGQVHCYADFRDGGVVYEEDCREFDGLGYAVRVGGPPRGPSEAAEALRWAMVYTDDAWGFVMPSAACRQERRWAP